MTATTPDRTKEVPNYPALTGMRFFAAFAIVLWHSQTGYFFKYGAFSPFLFGAAVQFFFVLSGFVLTVNASKYRRASDFLVARVARVWPGHMTAILFLFLVFWPFSLSLLHGPVLLARFAACVTMLQAWSPVRATYWALNAPSWSISVELAFYVAFPFLLPRLARRPVLGLAVILAAALGFVMAVNALRPGTDPLWLGYINPLVNAPDFALGMVAAMWMGRAGPARGGFARASAIELAAVSVALGGNLLGAKLDMATAIGWPGWVPQYLAVAAGVPGYALLIVALARYRGIVSRALSLRPIVYLGEISYTLYLFHQIMIRGHSGYASWHGGWKGWVAAQPIWGQYALLMAATLGLVIAVHHLIEQPARRRINGWWRRRRAAIEARPAAAIVGAPPRGDAP